MKKLVIFAVFVLSVTVCLTGRVCEAKDVWVARWEEEQVDVYVMDETLAGNVSENGRSFHLFTKNVRDDGRIDRIFWRFSKRETDIWRYETSRMHCGPTTPVSPEDSVFKFCMNALQWSYTVGESGCY